jgi:hypothetical protein
MSQVTRTLVLFKRHTKDCAVHKTRIPVDKRRFWMNCDCTKLRPVECVGISPSVASDGVKESVFRPPHTVGWTFVE